MLFLSSRLRNYVQIDDEVIGERKPAGYIIIIIIQFFIVNVLAQEP